MKILLRIVIGIIILVIIAFLSGVVYIIDET